MNIFNKAHIAVLVSLFHCFLDLCSGICGSVRFAFLALRADIVVFAPFPGYSDERDGYTQRLKQIDAVFSAMHILYVENPDFLTKINTPWEKVGTSIILRLHSGRASFYWIFTLIVFCIFLSRKVYFHSVLQMQHFTFLFYLPFVHCCVDFHGVVPEERRMTKAYHAALEFDARERQAVRKSFLTIFVSEAMRQFFQDKFRHDLKAPFLCLPNIPPVQDVPARAKENSALPVIVYAGGMAPWQQLPKMAEAIKKTAVLYEYRIFCPKPDAFRAMLPGDFAGRIEVAAKTHAEILAIYPLCQFGFVLRAESIVNRVACPTKLVEYLARGVVPIVECPDIGDFRALGMRYVPLAALEAGALPDEAERLEMARQNRAVYERLRAQCENGTQRLLELLK
jgi:hypothetical protein